ncbi:MAG: oligosaccharide flippase family protein, partial [Acetobacteraceae bacterium]|nr:oligosaccharide flippase family protein [Acetobacteraceae bacterium]
MLSQSLLFLATPIFVRFYSPADFGLYTFSYSLIALTASVGTWKVERFIVIAPTRRAAIGLLTAMIWLGAIMAVFALAVSPIIIFVARHFFGGAVSGITLVWLAPFSIFIFVAASGMRFYSMRLARFSVISAAQISRAAVFAAGTVATGLLWRLPYVGGAMVILAWQAVGDAGALLVQAWASPTIVRLVLLRPRLRRSFTVLKTYRKTLGVLTVAELISALNQQLQVSTVIFFFGATAGGWFSLARALVYVPCSVIAVAVMDVTNQRLSRYYAESKPFASVVLQSTLWMAALGIVPFSALVV